MVVRPFSWIFGGFPNEFSLYHAIETGYIKTIPSSTFIYFVFIFGIFILGVLYQIQYFCCYLGSCRGKDIEIKEEVVRDICPIVWKVAWIVFIPIWIS